MIAIVFDQAREIVTVLVYAKYDNMLQSFSNIMINTKVTMHYRKYFSFIFGIFVFLVALHSRGITIKDSNRSIRYSGSEAFIQQCRWLVENCTAVISDYVGELSETKYGCLHISEHYSPFESLKLPAGEIHLGQFMSRQKKLFMIARGLLGRIGAANALVPEQTVSSKLNWFAAAVVYDVQHRSPGNIVAEKTDYFPIQELLRNNRLPSLRHILSKPVSVNYRYCFQLYAVCSHFAVNMLDDKLKDKNEYPLRLLMSAVLKSKDIENALDNFGRQLGIASPGVNKWINDQAPNYLEEKALNLSASYLQYRLKSLFTYKQASLKSQSKAGEDLKGSTSSTVLLRNLSDSQAAELNPSDIPVTVQNKLLQLAFRAPYMLRSSVMKYFTAIEVFRNSSDSKLFIDNLKRAHTEFNKTIKRYKDIQELLLTHSCKSSPAFEGFARYLEIEAEERRTRQQIAPEIEAFLNRIE